MLNTTKDRLNIIQEHDELLGVGDAPMDAEQFAERVRQAIALYDSAPECFGYTSYQIGLDVEVDSFDDDCVRGAVYLYGIRPETDREYENRQSKIAAINAQNQEREEREYARLKAKFENQ